MSKNKYGLSIQSAKRKCCLCLSNVLSDDNSCELLTSDKFNNKKYTELGHMLISILKLSDHTLTRYCCQVCIDTVQKCFNSVLEINVAASLACQQLSMREGGVFQCCRCNDVLESIDRFTQHFKFHLLEACDDNSIRRTTKLTIVSESASDEPDEGTYDAEEIEFDNSDQEDGDDIRREHGYSRLKNDDIKDGEKDCNLCHECGKSYGSAHGLRLHLKRHDPHFKSYKRKDRIKGRHLCDKCGKSFTTVETLRVHREKHDTTCNVCGKSMYKKYMKRHLLSHDPSQGPKLQMSRKYSRVLPALESTPLQCDHCDKSYSDRFLLVNHIAMIHGGKFEKGQKRGKRRGIECSVCGLVLLSQPKLKQHKKEEHGVTSEDRMQCELCKRWYSGKTCLRTHIKYEHMQIKPYSCKLCPKVFKRNQGLWAHMRVHQNLRPYECGVCHVRYRQRYEVLNHLGKHVRAGDIKLDEAYAKAAVKGKLESNVIYLKDQKVKEVSDLAIMLQMTQ